MMRNYSIPIVISTLLFFASSSICFGLSADKQSIVPLAIKNYMKAVGCQPVREFYSNYMITEPPYVWINHTDFAVVCENNKNTEGSYSLSIKKDSKFFGQCRSSISLHKKPGGLSMEYRIIEEGVFFSLYDNKALKEIPNKKLKILVLATGDGGYMEFVCIERKWYLNVYS